MLKVNLISYPENSKKIIYTACSTCYSNIEPFEIFKKEISEEKTLKLINKVIESGHTSTLEHIKYVFTISGVSRAFSHQYVRMRHKSFSQKSQRYCSESKNGDFEYITPKTISLNKELDKEYKEFMKKIAEFYKKLQDNGIPNEDVRFILPNSCATSFTSSTNLREFIHVANLRLCNKTQWEFRNVVESMVNEVLKIDPWLKNILVPKCESIGYCNEVSRCCGRKPTKDEFFKN